MSKKVERLRRKIIAIKRLVFPVDREDIVQEICDRMDSLLPVNNLSAHFGAGVASLIDGNGRDWSLTNKAPDQLLLLQISPAKISL
jgi:hypothetical protein